jgi:mannose-6-phosphate isomerase-like protein (cupin superfamily)
MRKNVVHENESKEIPDICGKVLELINQDNSNCRLMSIATIFLDPGKSSTPHLHKEMEEIYYIIEGEGVIEIDGQTNIVKSGHAILLPIGSKHMITNTGQKVMKFISVDSPPFNEKDIYL